MNFKGTRIVIFARIRQEHCFNLEFPFKRENISVQTCKRYRRLKEIKNTYFVDNFFDVLIVAKNKSYMDELN